MIHSTAGVDNRHPVLVLREAAVTYGDRAALAVPELGVQLGEILAVIGLFGFLNRWNDTMATDLEEVPMGFASRTLGDHWGGPGKHRLQQSDE